MRASQDFLDNTVAVLREAEAAAIAAIGLRGPDARQAMSRARKAAREARWQRITRAAPAQRLTDDRLRERIEAICDQGEVPKKDLGN
jgi:hypothetical protein